MGIEETLRWPVLVTYFLVFAGLAGYGAHRWYLLSLYTRHRRDRVEPSGRLERLPVLTIQLPMFNEMYVAERLIDAVCAIDYPRDRLEIQVLDDSTDETREIAAAVVERWRRRGVDIRYLHRTDRSGFKAGALDAGLRVCRGELIAVFDADFVPEPDFAQKLVPHFVDPAIGMVQARWGHLNRPFSPLTRVQAMFLDGHFVIEHTARNRAGRFFNFNGTAGIWRKCCIEDAGGWQHDTLTEDLDLSYRAQMKGWKFLFLPDVVVPAELPVEMGAFKSQQHRWAKGSIQTARKLLPALLASDLPRRVKLEAVFHLTANVGYLLVLALGALVVPAIWLRRDVSPWLLVGIDLPLFLASSVSVAWFYVAAHREATGTTRGLVRWIPFLMAVGIGLSINNARAVLQALAGHVSEFRRTPKYNVADRRAIRKRRYRGSVTTDTWIELGLSIYFAAAIAGAWWSGLWGAVPFLALFLVGFGYTAGATLAQGATS